MLETILTALATAVLVSLAVGFALQWETRLRVRRAEALMEEFGDVITRYNKRRAAEASAASRARVPSALSEADAAFVRHVTGVSVREEPLWWEGRLRPEQKEKLNGPAE